ncbi:MAG: biopolymer transporter ExbD [Victivallales bacterium]|nr:biopolymer transporter ExbD [Victivallales bacterium]
MIMHWQDKLVEVKPPSTLIVLIDVFFILLVCVMVSSNYVFMPGIKGATLPRLRDAEIVRGDKFVITVTAHGEYFYNGLLKKNWQELEGVLQEDINAKRGGDTPVIVLQADRSLPYDKIMQFFELTNRLNAEVFLVSAPEEQKSFGKQLSSSDGRE